MSRANIFYLSFYINCANFVRIGPQIKKFPNNWVGPLKVVRVWGLFKLVLIRGLKNNNKI